MTTLGVRLLGERTRAQLHSGKLWQRFKMAQGNDELLLTASYFRAHGQFISATRTSAGTTVLTTPDLGGSVVLTDLIISGEKQAGSATQITFEDGTNTETIFNASQVDAPPTVGIAFQGRWQGWENARVEFITTGAGDATVALGYMKLPQSLGYSEWNDLR